MGFHLTDVLARSSRSRRTLHFQQAGDGVHGSRFTGTVGADQRDDFALIDVERYMSRRAWMDAVKDVDIFNRKHRHPHCHQSSSQIGRNDLGVIADLLSPSPAGDDSRP